MRLLTPFKRKEVNSMHRKLYSILFAGLAALLVSALLFRPLSVRANEADAEVDFEVEEHFEWDGGDGDLYPSDGDDSGSSDPGMETYAYISVYAHDSEIRPGSSTTVTASVYSNSTGSMDIRWSTSHPGVASVSGGGMAANVTGVSNGTAYITAALYINGTQVDSDTAYITVRTPEPSRIAVTGVIVHPESLNLGVGEMQKVVADIQPNNATNTRVSWSSTNSAIAKVDPDGLVHGINPGVATLTVRTDDNGYTAKVQVSVGGGGGNGGIAVQSVWVTPTTATLAINQYFYITPNIQPANAQNKSVTYVSSNPAVAVVAPDGKVTGVGPGQAVVNCITNDGHKVDATTVTVGTAVAPGAPAPAVPAAPVAPVIATETRSPLLCYQTVQTILGATPNATVDVPALQPMAYDVNVAAALNMRPDVTLAATFPYQGHQFRMTLPKGYPLAAQCDKTGYVEWLQLCALNNGVVVQMLN